MWSNAEAEIDKFLARLEKILPNIDTRLILNVMYYERSMRDAHPSAELEIHYKGGTNMEGKLEEMRSRFGMASLHGQNGVFVKARMNLATIEEISKDPAVEEIGGIASIASY